MSYNPREIFRSVAMFDKNITPFHFEAIGFWNETIQRWHREGLPENKTPWEYFEIFPIMDNSPDAISSLVDKVGLPAYYPFFKTEILQETEDYIIQREEDGIIKKVKKNNVSMPQFLQFPVRSHRDWEEIKERLNPDVKERYEKVKNVTYDLNNRNYILRFGLCGCYGLLRNLFGEEKLAYVFYDDPELIHQILKQWLYLYTGIADNICPLIDFDYVFIWEDMAYKTAPLISPAFFKDFILPYYKEFVGYMRDRYGFDIFVIDSDGNCFDLLDLFIEGGVTFFHPCEIAAGMEPLIIRGKYPYLALLGGIDKRALLKGGEEIKEEIDRKVPAMIGQGGYFPSLDHHVPSDISFENFCYYVEYLRKI